MAGQQQAISYQQYQAYALTTGATSLWISGVASWTQYAVVPLGASLSLVAITPAGGNAYFYEIYPDGSLDVQGYYFYQTNLIGFYADRPGRHVILFVAGDQPSNAVIIDVAGQQAPAQSSITVKSVWLNGYSVYVDGVFRAKDGSGETLDGTVTVSVPGDQYHSVAISAPGFSYSDYRYFKGGWGYTLNV